MKMIYKYAMICYDDDLRIYDDDMLYVCHVLYVAMLCIDVPLL